MNEMNATDLRYLRIEIARLHQWLNHMDDSAKSNEQTAGGWDSLRKIFNRRAKVVSGELKTLATQNKGN